jgi:hypothetical protein
LLFVALSEGALFPRQLKDVPNAQLGSMYDWLRIYLIAVGLLIGCSPAENPKYDHKNAATPVRQTGRHLATQPPVIMEVLDSSLQWCAEYWRAEIDRRFDGAVGVLVHGGDLVKGQWVVKASLFEGHLMPAEELVRQMKQRYPDRTIVLLACNPGHIRLEEPGVYYFVSNVWCVPDRAITPDMTKDRTMAQTMLNGIDDLPLKPQSHWLKSPWLLPGYPSSTRWEIDPTASGNIFEAIAD